MDNIENIVYSKESFYIGDLPYELTKAEYNETAIKYIVLIIPGNPGIVDFYERFSQLLLGNLGSSSAVWCISHSCFCQSDCLTAIETDAFLAREIEHKLKFIEQKIPADVDIILVGHSIGSYMILSLLDILNGNGPMLDPNTTESSPNGHLYGRIKKCFLLFPTIERMKVSPNGQKLLPVLNYMQTVCTLLAGFISLLPYSLRKSIASLFVPNRTDDNIISSIVALTTRKYMRNMLQLAENELNSVLELDAKMIETSLSKIVIYYGKTDHWCPLYFRDELVAKFPDLVTFVDDNEISHAFVVSDSTKMASILAKLIETLL